MIGEIRDRETAEMAIQSALTGHLVFSTLHTNDAASSVTRLLDLGIEPYLVASSVLGVLSQRLVRKICESCRTKIRVHDVSPDWNLQTAFAGAGCDRCRDTGYWGRIGLFELMVISDEIRDCIQSRANASEIRSKAIAGGMHLLQEDGLEKIENGLTTISEVQRVSTALASSE
jgi:type II secretory ATPase GspE/PulE/Tfp pilus assembly ATPase PilB-like protein